MIKKRYIFLIMFVLLFAVSAVNAAEIGNDTNMVANSDDSGLMAESVDENLLTDSYGTFKELQDEIDVVEDGGTLNLTRNYKYVVGSTDGINITKSITIYGNNHSIDGNNQSQIFKIKSDEVSFNDIIFINGNYYKKYNYMGGGAIYLWNGYSSININNCKFINNSATYGGSINSWNDGCSINIKNCEFVNNFADYGSAIYISTRINMSDCEFVNNYATYGGAIYFESNYGSTITDCEFVNNSASNKGGAIYCGFSCGENKINYCKFNSNTATDGGAIYFDYDYYENEMSNCDFINNSASNKGGAIYLTFSSVKDTMDYCKFINNSATDGGAIYFDYDFFNSNITNCDFINNSASNNGGAIFIGHIWKVIFSNLNFINNSASNNGGAIFSGANANYINSSYIIKNTIFINNFGDYGSAIYFLEKDQLGIEAEIFDSYFYTIENKELIYSADSKGYLFLKNNTMISPISYKIYTKLSSSIISSKKYLILENKTCYINKPFPITYTDDNGNKIRSDKDITIKFVNLNNKELSFELNASFDSNSGFYHVYCNQTGVYNLSVDTEFSKNFTIVPTILEIHSVKPDLSINANNKSYSENTTFYVNVTVDDYLVNEGNINFYIDDKKVGSTNVSNGLATFDYAYLKVGTFSILAIYEENDDYLSSNATALFTVNKMPTELSAESVIFDKKEDKIFTAELKDNNSNGISGQNVKIETIKYSGESRTFNGITDIEGIAEYNVKNLEGGMWFVTGTYDGNGNYINSKFSDKFIVIRMDTTTNITGIGDNPKVNHTYKLKANIHDENGKLVKEGIVQFYLDGVDIGSIDLSKNKLSINDDLLGICNLIFDYKLGDDDSDLYIEYTPSKAGTYALSAVYGGTTIYKSSNETTTLIVKEDSPFNVSAPDVTKYYGGPERFVVTVTDNADKPVANEPVKVTINGQVYDRKTGADGRTTFAINLRSGIHEATTEHGGDVIKSKITVKTTVISKDITKIFRNGTNYEASFLDKNGNKAPAGVKVSININSEFYQRTINDDGSISFVLNLEPGTYVLTLSNPVTGEEISNTVTILPNIVDNNDLVKYYNESKKFSVKVLDSTGKVAPGQKVIFTIGNTTYESTSDSKGQAFLNVILQPGTYIVTTTYGDLEVNNTIKILPTISDKDMQVSSSNINEGEKEIIEVVLPNDATGKVSTTINGKEYSANVNKGKANIIIPDLMYGTYNIDVIYAGDSQYNSVKGKTSFIVDKTIDLSVPDISKYYGGSERLYVTLKDKNGQPIANAKIKININGVDYDRTTNDNGQTSIALSIPAGNYTATVEYNGIERESNVVIKSTVSGNDITKIYRNGTQYYAKFVDTKGNILKNTPVEFNINGVFYTRTTNENGIAKMNINLNPKEYIITATNPNSNEMYSNVVTVLSNIAENHDLTKYYKNASQYVIRLLDDKGNPVGAGVSVEFNINGVFYTRTSNATGHVKMNINLNPGTYIITANYKGLMTSNTITVKPILQAKDLNMKYRDGSKFEVTLLDGKGNPFAGQKITFNINGVFYDRTTDENGIARLNINLMAGKYIITSMYSNGAATSNKVTIFS